MAMTMLAISVLHNPADQLFQLVPRSECAGRDWLQSASLGLQGPTVRAALCPTPGTGHAVHSTTQVLGDPPKEPLK